MNVGVDDPFGIAADPKLAAVAVALDPCRVLLELRRLRPEYEDLALHAIRVVRLKPARRFLIEYDVTIDGRCASPLVTWIGKARAKGTDRETFAVMNELWRNGFDDASTDGVSVPEPIGVIPAFHMWLQRKVSGTPALIVLQKGNSIRRARHIADALHKVHRTGLTTRRVHFIQDEMGILAARLDDLTTSCPQWSRRLALLLDVCEQLAYELPAAEPRGIHRDFHPEQVLVADARLYLLDFDLYCAGDPLLDAGNFLGHLAEFAIRNPQTSAPVHEAALAFSDQFLRKSDHRNATALQTYSLLSLMRLVGLSVRYSDRRPFTRRLLEVCEACLTPRVAHSAVA